MLLISTVQAFKFTELGSRRHFGANRIYRDLNRFQAKRGDDSKKLDMDTEYRDSPFASNLIIQTSALMFLLSAPLGMMLDNYHGKS